MGPFRGRVFVCMCNLPGGLKLAASGHTPTQDRGATGGPLTKKNRTELGRRRSQSQGWAEKLSHLQTLVLGLKGKHTPNLKNWDLIEVVCVTSFNTQTLVTSIQQRYITPFSLHYTDGHFD